MSSKVIISAVDEKNGALTFTLSNVNVSYANGLRRIILSEIPTLVIESYPYDKNNVVIHTNKSRLNNELLKQRLSSIPIHIDALEDFPYEEYILEINKANSTNTIIYVTSEDFKIKNIKTNKYLTQAEVGKIFPPDPISGDFIELLRLRPQIASNMDKEQLHLEAKFSISNAKNDGMFNVVSTCSYGNSLDSVKIKDAWDAKYLELEKKHSKEEIESIKKDWLILDSKRIFIQDSFDFIVETLGVYNNFKIVEIAASLLIKKLYSSLEKIKINMDFISLSEDTMENCYTITLENEDYTIGKILEYNFYNKYFLQSKTLNYVSFLKKHPHDTFSIIKCSYKTQITKEDILLNLEECVNAAILVINSIKEYFASK
uniref:DNA-directed RNA polymerase RpoA/D/Rpb3-type domain-containing protein n=1 Tax=viral metagenome TaxID=1070528 RepID=A0A6C0DXV3_9ZZZZ